MMTLVIAIMAVALKGAFLFFDLECGDDGDGGSGGGCIGDSEGGGDDDSCSDSEIQGRVVEIANK